MPLIEIKHRFDDRVLFSLECGSLKIALEAAVKSKAYLGGADLGGADLGGADLGGAYLGGADLRGADLRGAYLGGAYLRGAYLGGADLGGEDLGGEDLRGAKIDWQRHEQVSEILWREAGNNVERQMLAALIGRKTEWCWKEWLTFETPHREWALEAMARWVVDGDNAPEMLRELAAKATELETVTA